MTLIKIHKYPRVNAILIILEINLILAVNNNNFGLNITDLNSADYDVNVEEQKPNRLNFVAIKVLYRKSIAGKKIQLNYDNNRTRRLYSVDQSIPEHILFE